MGWRTPVYCQHKIFQRSRDGGDFQPNAAQANGRLSDEEKIEVSPHVLRHTFLRKLAETKEVHYAREASGHQSDRYIWRYVKPDQQTLADAIDALE
jgi:integrase